MIKKILLVLLPIESFSKSPYQKHIGATASKYAFKIVKKKSPCCI
ncbi:MAG: hypothetical protein ACI86H_002919 [bacterium]|jgi:hypothetical protein